MELDPNNEWIRLAHAIPWSRMETKYVAMFPSKTGHPATPFRMALGVLIIQKRKKLEVNEYILETSGVTKEHEPKNESKNAKAANTRSDGVCQEKCVSFIKFPYRQFSKLPVFHFIGNCDF